MKVLRDNIKLQPLTDKPAGLNRDVNGQIEFILKYRSKTYAVKFGENKIIEYQPWYITEPLVDFWNKPPIFHSFIQAVSWLKRNVDVFM